MRLLNFSHNSLFASQDIVSILVLVDAPLEFFECKSFWCIPSVSILVLVDAPLESVLFERNTAESKVSILVLVDAPLEFRTSFHCDD